MNVRAVRFPLMDSLRAIAALAVVGSHAALFAAGAAGSVAIASVSYYLVERPALSLKRLVPDRHATQDQPGAVSAPTAPPSV